MALIRLMFIHLMRAILASKYRQPILSNRLKAIMQSPFDNFGVRLPFAIVPHRNRLADIARVPDYTHRQLCDKFGKPAETVGARLQNFDLMQLLRQDPKVLRLPDDSHLQGACHLAKWLTSYDVFTNSAAIFCKKDL